MKVARPMHNAIYGFWKESELWSCHSIQLLPESVKGRDQNHLPCWQCPWEKQMLHKSLLPDCIRKPPECLWQAGLWSRCQILGGAAKLFMHLPFCTSLAMYCCVFTTWVWATLIALACHLHWTHYDKDWSTTLMKWDLKLCA